jgi:hypothetical protein
VAAFTRGPGSIAIFTPGAGGITVPTLTNTNGILGGWATVGGDWATKNASNQIVAYTGYTTLTGTPTIASDPASNVRITAGTTGNIALAAAGTTDVNTVQLTDTIRRDLIIGAGNHAAARRARRHFPQRRDGDRHRQRHDGDRRSRERRHAHRRRRGRYGRRTGHQFRLQQPEQWRDQYPSNDHRQRHRRGYA